MDEVPIFECLTAGWVNYDVGLFFLLEKVAKRGDITRLGASLPNVVGRRTWMWRQVIARLQNWVVTVRLDDGRSWCWGRPPCTWCGTDWGGRHRLGGGLVSYNGHPWRKCSWGKFGHPLRRCRKIWLENDSRCGARCHGIRSCWGTCSEVRENAGECLDGGELIVAQRCKWGWRGI